MQSNAFLCSLVGLSNKVLSNLVPEGAAKLPEVKVEDAKKRSRARTLATCEWVESGLMEESFSYIQL